MFIQSTFAAIALAALSAMPLAGLPATAGTASSPSTASSSSTVTTSGTVTTPSTVTIDRTAVIDGDTVTLTGRYSCTGAGGGSLYTEVASRDYVGRTAGTAVVCDGATHRWTTTGPRENLTRGSATALATLELCAEPASCTTDFFNARVTVRSA